MPSKPVQADELVLLDSMGPGWDREKAETLTGKRETETLLNIIRTIVRPVAGKALEKAHIVSS
jgi:hypothetical protein